jgi:hypothetical protein
MDQRLRITRHRLKVAESDDEYWRLADELHRALGSPPWERVA